MVCTTAFAQEYSYCHRFELKIHPFPTSHNLFWLFFSN